MEPPRRRPNLAVLTGLLALAVVVSVPSVRIGLVNDDYAHRASYLGRIPGYDLGAFRLYEFIDPAAPNLAQLRDRGGVPWSTPLELKLRFFRPLASGLLALDVELFGDSPWLPHVHSILWHLVLVAMALALYLRTLPRGAAIAAALLFVLSGVHTDAVGWMAARHLGITALLTAASVWLLLRADERGRTRDHLLALVPFIVGLLVAEAAIATLGYVIAFHLSHRAIPLRARLGRLLPWIITTAVYLALYRAGGYGTAHTGHYLDPFAAPVQLASELPARIGALVAELTLAAPSVLFTFFPSLGLPMVAAALVTGAVLFVTARLLTGKHAPSTPNDERPAKGTRRALWLWGGGSLLALLPFAPAFITGRVLVAPGIGASALLGFLLARGASVVRDRNHPRGRRMAYAALAAAIALLPVFGGFAMRQLTVRDMTTISQQTRQIVATMPDCEGDALLLTSMGDPVLATMLPMAVATLAPAHAAKVRSWHALSTAPADHRLDAITDRGFDLVVQGRRGRSFWEDLFRPDPMPVGERRALTPFAAQVIEASDEGPTRLRFTFAPPLTRQDRCFVIWTGERMQRIDVSTAAREIPFRPAPIVRQRLP